MAFSTAMGSLVVRLTALTCVSGFSTRQQHARKQPPLPESELAKQSKPHLRLTFQMAWQTPSGDIQFVSADESRLALAVTDPVPNATQQAGKPRDGMVLNFANDTRFQRVSFFDEQVCFQFDFPHPEAVHEIQSSELLDNIGSNSSSSSSNRGNSGNSSQNSTKRAFIDALGEFMGVPLELYTVADKYDGELMVAGSTCHVWRAEGSFRQPAVSSLPGPQVFGQSWSQTVTATKSGTWGLGRARGGAMNNLTQVAAAKQDNNSAPVEIGDMEVDERVSFCVTVAGQVLATNASSRVSVEMRMDPDADFTWNTISQEDISTFAAGPPSLEPDATSFDGAQGAVGGRCVDLTSGSVGAEELRQELNDKERLKRINREAKGLWEAAPYKLWEGIMVEDVVASLGTELRPLRLPLGPEAFRRKAQSWHASFQARQAFPKTFDPRKRWPNCPSIGTIRNQGACGSCWAFAASAVLADRFCIAVDDQRGDNISANALLQEATLSTLQHLTLAPEHMVDCDGSNHGCGGGRLDDAWRYLRDHGVPTEACTPYRHCPLPAERSCAPPKPEPNSSSLLSAPHDSCSACAGGDQMQVYRAGDAYAAGPPGNVPALQIELMSRGPVEVGFYVFSDLPNYQSGVYSRTPGAYGPLGGHAVRLLGWGSVRKQDEDVEYWLVANSWSQQWGMEGFFWIRRGTNECGIETTPAAGLPRLDADWMQNL